MAKEKKYDATLPPVRLPSELLERTQKKSNETGVPIAFVVRKALEEWTQGEKKKSNARS